MKEVAVHQVDAFAEAIFGGNPAGVVSNADALTEAEMQNIAREMNLSETAFVVTPTVKDADVRFRFFTPTQEIPFCGHATVGALFQLAMLNLFSLGKPGENKVRVETGAGVLPATIANTNNTPKITFGAPSVEMVPYRLQGKAFAEAFGIPSELIKVGATILLDKKLNYIYVPAASLDILGRQNFNFDRIREQFGGEEIIAFALYTNETFSDSSDLHARGLAPNVGIDEDPFTGSIQAGLVAAAKQNSYINADKELIITEQGNFIGRPGKATVAHNIETNEFTVTANAAPVFSSTWRI